MHRLLVLLPLIVAAARPPANYIIITPARLAPGFDQFVHWKTRKGVWTEIVPIETVLAQTPGRDRADRLRRFVRHWRDSLGTTWVLLAGDTVAVPTRMVSTPGNITELSPCDMYFSDLDRDWDTNGNGVYGEEGDSIDMYTDVFLGRAVVTDTTQVRAVVAKWLDFELQPEPDFLRKLLFAGDSFSLTLPPGWFCGRLSSPPGRHELIDSLNSGFQLVSHVGHSDGTSLLVGTQLVLNLTDVSSLQNAHRLNLFLTVGSQAGATDRPSIGSALLARANAGSIAVLANSRAGWVGRSEMLNRLFLSRFFAADTFHEIGRNFSRSRDAFVSLARTDRYWRQTLYVWHLLGDPNLPIWKDTARTLDVAHPVVLDTGLQDFPIQVVSGGMPARAFVCLWLGNDVYERCWVEDSGAVTIHPRSTGELLVTVTGPGYRPYQGSCGIATAQTEPPANQRPRVSYVPSRAGIIVSTDQPATIQLLDVAGRCETTLLASPLVSYELHPSPGVKFIILRTPTALAFRKLVQVR